MALLRSFATVGGLTGVSRVLGLVRDILIAQAVGAEAVADAFFVAFRLPNMFRRIFAEGAFNAAFVPLFARRLEQEGQASAKVFAEQALSLLVSVLLPLLLLAMVAMPWLMMALAPGFLPDTPKFELSVDLARITFPYLLFMALVALLSGLLNSLYRFAAAAAAPILLNVFFILALALIFPLTGNAGHVMAWAVAAAGMGQFLLLMAASGKAGFSLRLPRPRVTPGSKQLLRLMLPGVISASALQINLVIGTIIASQQAGAVSFLYYADRVYQLPLGLIGIAFGVVLLPDLARKLRSGADTAAMNTMNRGLELGMLLTLPAAVALLVIAEPIVIVLFERGALQREGSQAIAWALVAFAFGLPSFVLVKILQPAFFAREDTKTPLKFALWSVAANIALSLILFVPLKHVGIALATSLAGWLNCALLAWRLKGANFLVLDERCRSRLPRILLAAIVMGAALWWLDGMVSSWFDADFLQRLAALAILVAIGLLVFAGATLAFGGMSLQELRDLLSRSKKTPPGGPSGSGGS